MATEEIDFNLNDFDEQLTPCTFDSQFFDSDEIGENSQLTDSDKSSNTFKKDKSVEQQLLANTRMSILNQNGNSTSSNKKTLASVGDNQFRQQITEDFSTESWPKFTGLKSRHFLDADLEAFKKPFLIGWKRELVLRDSVLHPGKKTVEVFYHSPCGNVKLRSYVEMGMYFRTNQDTELEPENFTFVKQPIYTKPNETIVYVQATENGQSLLDKSSLPPPPLLTPLTTATTSSCEVSKIESIDSDSALTHSNSDSEQPKPKLPRLESVSEGRAKRRRNAPSRFEDEDYSEQSLVKKKVRLSNQQPPPLTSTRNLNLPKSPSPSSLPKLNPIIKDDKPETVSKKNSSPNNKPSNNDTHEDVHKDLVIGKTVPNETELFSNTDTSVFESIELDKNGQQKPRQSSLSLLMPSGSIKQSALSSNSNKINGQALNKRLAISMPKMIYKQKVSMSKPISMKLERKSMFSKADVKNADSADEEEHFMAKEKLVEQSQGCVSQNFVPPCSIMCGGRQGDLPSLLCSRCLCLFHPECVCKGIYLKKNNNFVCPNCIQSSDDGVPSSITPRIILNEELETVRHPVSPIDQPVLARSYIPEINFKSILKPSPNHKSKVSSVLLPSCNLNADGRKVPAAANSSLKAPSLAAMLQQQNNNQHSVKHSIQSPTQSTLRSVLMTGVKPIKNVTPNPRMFDRPRENAYLKSTKNSTSLLHTLKNGTNNRIAATSARANPELELNNSIANRRFHLENLNRSILSSQQLLQSLQKLTANSMTPAPLSLNSAFMRIRKPIRHRYRDYLNRKYAGFDSLLSGYNALRLIFEHLNTRDLMRFKLVSKSFYTLASQKALWKTIRLKNIRIRGWDQFGINISENSVNQLYFDGIRPCSDESTDQMWQRASALFPHLKSVQKLSFGRVPISFIVRLLEYAASNSSFIQLEELSIRSLFDDAPQSGGCPLRFLQQLPILPALNSLRIASLGGFTPDTCCLDRLNHILSYIPKLICLYLPTLKGFSVDQFSFLQKLDQLEKLEIGSCESWITCVDNSVDLQPDDQSPVDGQANLFSGAFKYLSCLVNLRELIVRDVIFDEVSHQLSLTLQQMTKLRTLELEAVTVSPDATQTLNLLCNTIRTKLKNLQYFSISTNDSHTNKCVFELLLKRLDCVRELRWKVGSQVDDSGMCCVPFLQETEFSSDLDNETHLDLTTNDETNTEMMEMCYLNDVLQKHLQHARISILPQ